MSARPLRAARVLAALAALPLLAPLGGCSETISPPAPPVDWASLREPPARDGGLPRATAKERGVATAYAAAFASPGFARLKPLLADEARMTFGGKGTLGHDRVVAMHQTLFGAFDDRSLRIERIWMTDSEQAFSWVLSGVHARDWMGVPATHKRFSVKGLSIVWTKDDGSIADLHVYLDEMVLRAELGAGPADLASLPPPAPPTGAPEVIEQHRTPAEAADLGTLRGMVDALEDGKAPAYAASVADDFTLTTLEQAEPARGVDAARAYFALMRKSVGQLDTLAQGGFGAGDWAVLEYSISGVQLAPVGHVPFVRGRVVRTHVVDVARFESGKVAQLFRYDDPGEMVAP